MGGSYTVMLTAFYVDNGKNLPLWDRLPTAAHWVLHAVVATPRPLHRPAPAPSTIRARPCVPVARPQPGRGGTW
jgi:hypothetical protein